MSQLSVTEGMAMQLRELRRDAYRGDSSPVFATATRTPISRSNISSRVLKPTVKNVGLGWVSFHTFRHTCASLLFDAGKNVKQVQEWLGHADPGFTLRTYVHLLDEGLGSADFMDNAVRAAGTEGNTGATEGPATTEKTKAAEPAKSAF